ncbi:LysR substrate-binding domain-containing protein [Knoellia sp. p5-6-4]|nr:LysR substrate-binding domain-containing protein [Knoellia sp. p5-6-4]MDF2144462.1 LysR substrate-binding domain-containing protein [Knoellia sp. p5-6-4]
MPLRACRRAAAHRAAALSQQIKQLEAELGVQLLHRSTRRVELTQAGKRYLERARAIVAAGDDAGREATRVAAGEVGRVSLGFVGSTTYELMPSLARVLRKDFPLVELDLHGEMISPDQVAALHTGALDLAFVRPPVRDPDLRLKVLRREPLVAVLPESHLLAGLDAVLRARRPPGGGGDVDAGLVRGGGARCRPGARLGAAPRITGAVHRSLEGAGDRRAGRGEAGP